MSGFTAWEVTAEGPDGPVRIQCLSAEEARAVAAALWVDEAYSGIAVREVVVR